MKMCWKWERMQRGEKGSQPSSWKITVTMSLPMCRFRSSCRYRNTIQTSRVTPHMENTRGTQLFISNKIGWIHIGSQCVEMCISSYSGPYTDTKTVPTVLYIYKLYLTTSVLWSLDCGPSVAHSFHENKNSKNFFQRVWWHFHEILHHCNFSPLYSMYYNVCWKP